MDNATELETDPLSKPSQDEVMTEGCSAGGPGGVTPLTLGTLALSWLGRRPRASRG